MNPRIHHISPNMGAKHRNLILTPSQCPCQARQSHTLQIIPHGKVLLAPHAELLVLLILGPLVLWPFVDFLDNVDEAGFSHLLLGAGTGVEREAELAGCFH